MHDLDVRACLMRKVSLDFGVGIWAIGDPMKSVRGTQTEEQAPDNASEDKG